MIKSTRTTRREGGFTLIELIAVVIILGILAAVITPRYFDMATQAENTAFESATNEASSRLNLAYAASTMQNGAPPANLAALAGTNAWQLGATLTSVPMGDYQVSYTGGTGTTPNVLAVTIAVQRVVNGTAVATTNTHATRTVVWPGN